MLCEECNEQPATVFLTQVFNGKSTRRQLCTTCAEPILSQISQAGWTSYAPTEGSSRELPERTADRPAEVFLSDPISILDLATALRIRFDQVVTALVKLGVSDAPGGTLNFATASLVCQHYAVTAHKVA